MAAQTGTKRRREASPSPNQNTVPFSTQKTQKTARKKERTSDSVSIIEHKEVLHPYNTRYRSRTKNASLVTHSQVPLVPVGNINVQASTSSVSVWRGSAPAATPVAQAHQALPKRFLSPAGLVVTDEDLHLVVHQGDVLYRRYQIISALGSGTFGRVMAVRDLKKPNGPDFALKITQSTKEALSDWEFERDILLKLTALDPQRKHNFVRLFGYFIYHGHPCLVFEKLGQNLHKFLQMDSTRAVALTSIRLIARQLCDAIGFLHANGLTHTDLKPENIVFATTPKFSDTRIHRDGKYHYVRTVEKPEIRVIDFGSAINEEDHHGVDVTTRQYRSPEVILELGWTYPIDVWSIGCILYEIYTKKILFYAPTVKDQLGAMERILGPIPAKLLKQSNAKGLVVKGKFDYNNADAGWTDVERKAKPLKESMRDHGKDTVAFFDLLAAMLRFDPRTRITLEDALQQRFFS